MIRGNKCVAILTLSSVALIARPIQAAETHTVTITYSETGGCIDEGSITVNPDIEFVSAKDTKGHRNWFAGQSPTSDAPSVRWDVTQIDDYSWHINIKDPSKRQFFNNNDLSTGTAHQADNQSKKVDKWGPPHGISWKYQVTATYTGGGDCETVVLDPQVKFKSGG